MRSIKKTKEPKVLAAENAAWLAAYKADLANKAKKYRYRHKDIKDALKVETSEKCAYCESKIGHNTPGDVEHKIPSSVDRDRHFDWKNLTIACTECNRRKNAYYSALKPFLDPYSDAVETRVLHHGPICCWAPGDVEAEVTVRILELHNTARASLISRKVERIDHLNNVVARLSDPDPLIQTLMRQKIVEMKSSSAEYSGMIVGVCKTYGI